MANTKTSNGGMSAPKLGLFMTTALASVALTGCMTAAAPPAETSFAKAQVALEKGQVDKAIAHAESAVLAEPRNPGFRAMLGAAYLEAGRFDSAATSFGDALELGDQDPRTVLSYALAKTALGDNASALAKLNEYESAINPADFGLAIALAGAPERGVHVLVNTLRGGQNSAKVRQNLAYTYALAGNWRAARVMAAEDVPADQLDARLSDWAANARPEDYQVRVAGLLNVTPVRDGGQPTHLALANFPSQQMMVAEAADQVPVEVAEAPAEPSEAEKLAFGEAKEAAPAEDTVAKILTATGSKSEEKTRVAVSSAPKAEPAAKPGPRFISKPVIQSTPTKVAAKPAAKPVAKPAAKPASKSVTPSNSQRRMAVATGKADTHLVQLGSFSSRDVAKAKWTEMQRKVPALAGRDVVITEANVKGKTYFRVAAAGFGAKSAKEMCSTAKAKGLGCFAYAASNPPAGAVDRGVRIAARTR